MADKNKQAEVVVEVEADVKVEAPTIEQLQAQITDAATNKDYKLVSKLAQQLVKTEADVKAKELKAKQDALAAITGEVGKLFNSLVGMLTSGQAVDFETATNFQEKIEAIKGTELDAADGVWYSNDFGVESGHAVNIKLMKGSTKAASGERKSSGGGVGKKFDVTTEEMIAEVGEDAVFGDGTNGSIKAGSAYAGLTTKEAWDKSSDKNWRYTMRTYLLKHTNRV